MNEFNVAVPLIHLNGSGAQSLIDQNVRVVAALREAEEALRYASPNQRDYYPLDPEVWRMAREDHERRQHDLARIRGELSALILGVMAQRRET